MNWPAIHGQIGKMTTAPMGRSSGRRRRIGGAFAALLSLTGTGLVAEYKAEGGPVVWRDVCGSLEAFGAERDRANVPCRPCCRR